MPSDPKDFSAKVAEAEEAVKSVKDPELRRVAFEKVLEHLLQGSERPSASTKKPVKKAKAGKRTSKASVSNSKKGPKARLVELVEEGFFKKQRTLADVKTELANRGFHIPSTSLSGPLQSLTQEKLLRRQKISGKGKSSSSTYVYSNW